MSFLIVTNNPKIKQRYEKKIPLEMIEGSYRDVLLRGRDLIHDCYRLETHPLSGSIKPNETPFRTLVLSLGKNLDSQGLVLIEEAIQTYDQFQKNETTPRWVEGVLEDFMTIDYSISSQAIDRLSPYPIH